MPDSGIYRIDFPNGKFYYGQSQSLRARKAQHMCNLRLGRHGNPIMQACWNKYGEATFTKVLSVPVDRLNEVEQSYLNVFVGMENCANIQADASSSRGRRWSEAQYKARAEQVGDNSNRAVKIRVTDLSTGIVRVFGSMTTAAEAYGIKQNHLSTWLTGKANQPCDNPRRFKSTAHLRSVRFEYA